MKRRGVPLAGLEVEAVVAEPDVEIGGVDDGDSLGIMLHLHPPQNQLPQVLGGSLGRDPLRPFVTITPDSPSSSRDLKDSPEVRASPSSLVRSKTCSVRTLPY